MKNLLLVMSLVALVSCNGKSADAVRKALGEDAYTEEEVDSLNCNEDILGWANDVTPGNVETAYQMMNERPEYKGCGNFDLYIEEVINEHPEASYLRSLVNGNRGDEGEVITEEDTYNDLSEAQVNALNCNEDFLGWDSNPPADLAEAKEKMKQNRGYKKCGSFELYIDEVTHSNPEVEFLKELLN